MQQKIINIQFDSPMGTVCAKPADDVVIVDHKKKKSSQSIQQSISVHGVEFILNDQLEDKNKKSKLNDLIKPDSCLVIFSESNATLQDHIVLNKFGENVGNKVQKFKEAKLQKQAQAYAKQSKGDQNPTKASLQNNQDIIIVPIVIKNVVFKHICIVNVNIWSGADEKAKVAQQLTDKLKRAFTKILGRGMKNIVITEVNEEFGIPEQICAKCLCQSLAGRFDEIENLLMVCSNENSLQMHEEYFNTAMKSKSHSNSSSNPNISLGIDQRKSSIYY